MKKLLIICAFICASHVGAQTSSSAKQRVANTQIQASVPPVVIPSPQIIEMQTGPVGIGPLKIGMTVDQINALSVSDGVYLLSGMQLSAPVDPEMLKRLGVKLAPVVGERYEGDLVVPFSENPVKSKLIIYEGKLASVYVRLDGKGLTDKVTDQITDKYGSGKVDDRLEEELCIYKNGANYKLKSGAYYNNWSQSVSSGPEIKTKIGYYHIQICRDITNPTRVITSPEPTYSLYIGFEPNKAKSPNAF